MFKVMQGIAFLHSQGIMHRDIKSDNILISTTGEIRITGFQYSCFLESKQ